MFGCVYGCVSGCVFGCMVEWVDVRFVFWGKVCMVGWENG